MHKTLRFAIVFAYLFTASPWSPAPALATAVAPPEALEASPSQLGLEVFPSHFFVFDAENFLRLSGASPGQVSTVVTYTTGNTVLSVQPQFDADDPLRSVSEVWVPFEVSNTAGHWEVRVIAYDSEFSRVYGPASLEILERPQFDLPPPLPEVLVVEAGSGGTLDFDPGDAICDIAPGSELAAGTTTVHCTLGSEVYSFSVVVTDTTPPVLTIPEEIVTTEHIITFEASAIDNLDGPRAVTCVPASGFEFPDGETMVECGVQDAHANYTNGVFLVTVGPPVFHLDGDITTEATGPAGAIVNYNATVGSGTIECAPASGLVFPITTTQVLCAAENAVGTSTAAFNVSVVDTTPPTLMAPGNIVADASVTSGVVVNFTTQATDIVSGNVAVICSTPSGSTFPVGTTQVDCTATDGHNNATSASFTVTVIYNPPPAPLLTAGPARVWLGLKNNSNKNPTFDLLTEVLLNGVVVGSGQTNGVGGGPGFGNAVLRTVAMTMTGATPILPGDTLALRVSVRMAANSAASSATARLWINDAGANSRLGVVIQGTTTTQAEYFLRDGSVLGAVGSGPKITVDVDLDKNVGGNPFKPFAVWTVQY